VNADGDAWSTFLTCDLIEVIDREFRTIANPLGRVLAGQSTGGFNAIQIALSRPGIFGAVAASAPDALDLEAWLLTDSGGIKEQWLAWMRLEQALGAGGQMISYARSWTPSSAGYEWPADLNTGAVRPEVLMGWVRQSPLRLLDGVEAKAALLFLEGRLLLGASTRDEFGLFEPTQRFSKRLEELRIPHRFLPDQGGHFDASARLTSLVRIALEGLTGVLSSLAESSENS
jgi:hypothetical protein